MSATRAFPALVDDTTMAEGGVLLLSPAVGILQGIPAPGRMLAGGETFARLTILGRTHPLLVPGDLTGVVAELALDGFGADAIAVEYGQPILTLAPLEAARDRGAGSKATGAKKARRLSAGAGQGAHGKSRAAVAAARSHPGAHDIPAGSHAVVSPADGVFYRRPRPIDPPYVEKGARVHSGQTLALIEAMKCFSAITYGGAGLPDEAEVIEIRSEDAAEVTHGQVLFVVK